MLDESEFKPFSLTDFTAVESDPSENDDTSESFNYGTKINFINI